MHIIILGGGPCGLGAAWRLAELGHADWTLYERNGHWGGLAASFTDSDGFCWDLGGHVLFSHYTYFDQAMDQVLGKGEDGWCFHEREAWVRMQERFIPYPLQNNIHRLPREIFLECIDSIIDILQNPQKRPENFSQWIHATFGAGLAKWFMIPYNFKVWAHPAEMMDWSWVGERVSPVDLKRILKNAFTNQDDISWGPNSRFRFPRSGGTGAIWNAMARRLPPSRLRLSQKAIRIDPAARKVEFEDGEVAAYDLLLSTLPLTRLAAMLNSDVSTIQVPALKSSGTHIVGLALKGRVPEHLETKCWIYFPEDNAPFYRATVFSNYSPQNVPDIERYWSLMCEVSQSDYKPVSRQKVVQDVIDGAINTGLITGSAMVEHTWHHVIDQGYPTPSLGRDGILLPLLGRLENMQIYSRGRFGGWRYEVGNMDHCFMQGVEFANRALFSTEELTLWHPHIVNTPHPSGNRR